MIRRYRGPKWTLHIEAHWGYRTIVKIMRTPYAGMRLHEGGHDGYLVHCMACDGDGFMFQIAPPRPARWDR